MVTKCMMVVMQRSPVSKWQSGNTLTTFYSHIKARRIYTVLFLSKLEEIYGKITPLTIRRGDINVFGIKFHFSLSNLWRFWTSFSLKKVQIVNLTWTSKETSTAVSVIGHHKGISSALEAHEGMVAKWWVSVSFAVHPDFKILSGASFTLSKSAQCSKSKKKGQYRYNRSLILFEHDERISGRNSTRHINVR